VHRNLRPDPRVARRRLDLEQPLLDLGYFELKELHDELRRGAREDELRPARLAVDLHHPGAHAVAHAQVLLGDHVLARQHGFQAPGLDDGAAALHALHGARDELVAARQEVVQDLLALGVADALQDHLLRRLRADAAELDVGDRLLDDVVELRVGLALLRLFHRQHLRGVPVRCIVRQDPPAPERLVRPGVAVDMHPHVDVLGVLLLGRRSERHLKRAEDDVARHILLAREHVHEHDQLPVSCRHCVHCHSCLTVCLLQFGYQLRPLHIVERQLHVLPLELHAHLPPGGAAQYADELAPPGRIGGPHPHLGPVAGEAGEVRLLA
jgi:hypothetical protein